MDIYCGYCFGKRQNEARRRGMGMMISTCTGWKPDKSLRGMPLALDNGAFSLSRRGYPFLEEPFKQRIMECYKAGLSLDFIVVPDLVGRGIESLKYSYKWATDSWLASAPNKALAVQDGVTPATVFPEYYRPFTHIFVGGSVEWKWERAELWIEVAHRYGLKCHIGQAGRKDAIALCRSMGADSIDSTSFTQNGTFGHADTHYQGTLYAPKRQET